MNWKRVVKNSVVTNMGNMGIYFEEEHEKSRWDSGQAILHRENTKTQGKRNERKEDEAYSVRNSYGNLRYLKKGKKRGEDKEGFVLEAFEAPGTPLHTEKEKHLDRKTMKRVRRVRKQTLYSSEVPFENQALFLDMAGSKRSRKFVDYMKELLRTQGHQTLRDTLGFLDQEPERRELEERKAEEKDYLSSEYNQQDKQILSEEKAEAPGKRIDTLNSRIIRKEAKERQLRTELQFMLEERAREEARQNKQESDRQTKEKKKHDDSGKKNLHSVRNVSETPLEGTSSIDETEAAPEDSESEI